jgi:hypothetical protein
MNQSPSLYATSEALALLDPWLRAHLPTLEEAVTRRFIQLVTAIFEKRSLLLETIAESSVFTGTDSSNVTQVRRIIRDVRITLEKVFFPLLEQLLAELQGDVLYLTLDETSHHTDYCVVQIGLTTDGVSLPLGFHIYAPDASWAEDARDLLETIDAILPQQSRIVLLADRFHTGEPFLACLDELQWYYVFRASESTQVEHPTKGWMPLKRLYKRANTGRYLSAVRLWKQGLRRANISIYKLVRDGFRTTIWYIVSDLPAAQERLAEYACRWWQEMHHSHCPHPQPGRHVSPLCCLLPDTIHPRLVTSPASPAISASAPASPSSSHRRRAWYPCGSSWSCRRRSTSAASAQMTHRRGGTVSWRARTHVR